ncbi:aminoacylase, partial [Danaus plexippus plexippus]
RTFPGGTDSRFIRLKGTLALGVTPLRHTRPGIHEHNENITTSAFLEGITVYEAVIQNVANV